MYRRAFTRAAAICIAASLFAALPAAAQRNAMPNTLTDAEKKDGWTLLFDGKTLNGWHRYQQPGNTEGWEVQDGALTKTTANADLLSDRTFANFELLLEWKIQAKGNSGIFFWATEDTKVVYMNAPEIQVLDNAGHPDGKSPLTSAGALYGLFPSDSTFPKPVGEWNLVRVVAKGSVIETWFNGHKIARADFDSPELLAQIAKTKFAAWPTYGKSRKGSIGLQEHGNIVWYRNIKIRELK